MEEKWETLVLNDLYEVSTKGEIRSSVRRGPRIHAYEVNGAAYVDIRMPDCSTRRPHRLAYLVASQFNDDADVDDFYRTPIRHLDGDPMNCSADNLEWEI